MSDTPRTDAECGIYDRNGIRHTDPNGDHVDPDFARDLERELATVTNNALALSQANAELRSRIRRLEEALGACDDAFVRFAPLQHSRYGDCWEAVRAALGRPNPHPEEDKP